MWIDIKIKSMLLISGDEIFLDWISDAMAEIGAQAGGGHEWRSSWQSPCLRRHLW